MRSQYLVRFPKNVSLALVKNFRYRPGERIPFSGNWSRLFSLAINDSFGGALFAAGRYDDAIAQFKKTIDLDPG